MEALMVAKVEADICIGCTLCVQTSPGIFRMEGDKAVAYVSPVPKDVEDTCKQAADECPVNAILIE
jgi:ferredoxin